MEPGYFTVICYFPGTNGEKSKFADVFGVCVRFVFVLTVSVTASHRFAAVLRRSVSRCLPWRYSAEGASRRWPPTNPPLRDESAEARAWSRAGSGARHS